MRIFVAIAGALISQAGWAADEPERRLAQMNARSKAVAAALNDYLAVHGQRIRVAAMLESCEMSGFAQSVLPGPEVIRDLVIKQTPVDASFDEVLVIWAASESALRAYRLGVIDGYSGMLKVNKDRGDRDPFCASAVGMANKLLAEKT